ncbi:MULTISPECIES: Qat anti-phage system TatD family nuclease QatD [unclassified Arcicella]|uniref:Qat anti-phage system TatD family nuclease QatD n=1 Tax=unclassified Arcicella TaxID=2644986 RepID=UPI0028676949|nr:MULTISPECIES: Qat anti-phage system TatD family nuclease QatD [unclassified Arcicella]MDR6564224.1 TatD DNase family protein [Arcicella sp. BE51]MDR6811529.1 TatD DNase family protein [Arcicella sp. BE140]MDR6823055.1 TatD DNase family protein [Arcicella sp. BE139]
MIIDTHCHIDLYDNPEKILSECERIGISVIAMTNLPSHFEVGYPFLRMAKKTRISLGLHPLLAENHKSEFNSFLRNLDKTSYIGEVGLDFSREGIRTKEIQIDSFEKVLQNVSNKKKILSIHSRRAEKEVLELLVKYKISNAVFHWYSGPIHLINKIIDAGYYFSINPSMIDSANGRTIISKIPIDKMLTESDGPFVKFNQKTVHPWDLTVVLNYISTSKQLNVNEVEMHIQTNFYNLISRIK